MNTNNKTKAFTLTEILVAVVIVGVISALVLPTVISHYQNNSFNQAFRRETKTIQSAIEDLAVSENKGAFSETMMYTTEEPTSYNDTAEKFIKTYLRPSKLYGDNNGDCFAKTYYYYDGNDKKVYTPNYKGSCAKLKNGASICLTTQTGARPIAGIIDLNGDKGPNVLNKDLRTFTLDVQTQAGRNTEVAVVLDYKFDPIGEPCAGKTCGCGTLPPCDPCEGQTCGCGSLPECEPECSSDQNDWDESCCEANYSSISPHTHCCYFSKFSNTEACGAKTLTFNVDYDCYYQLYSFSRDENYNLTNTTYKLGGDGCKLQVYGNIPSDFVPGNATANLEFRIIDAKDYDPNNLSNSATTFYADIINGQWAYQGNALGNMYNNDNLSGVSTHYKTGDIRSNPAPYLTVCDGACTSAEYLIDAKQLEITTTSTGLYHVHYEGRNLKLTYFTY